MPKLVNFKKILKEVFKLTAVVIIFFAIVCGGFFAYIYFFDNEPSDEISSADNTQEEVAAAEDNCNVIGLNLHGMLLTYLPPDTLNDNGDLAADISASENILSGIMEAEKDENIKAIFLEVDSQGGLPVAGQEIMTALKAAQKPTVALIRQMGASGAYLAATGADTIFASPYSDVGGIGVTQSYLENYEKNRKEGLNFVSLASGKFKDIGNPDKPLTKEEKDLWMRDVLKVHELFVKTVAENRNLPVEKVSQLADGSTVLGEAALENGLIDKLGEFGATRNYIKDLIGEEPDICWY
jgi:signal peptide peptidase SppA